MEVWLPFWIWQCHVVARRPIRHFLPVKPTAWPLPHACGLIKHFDCNFGFLSAFRAALLWTNFGRVTQNIFQRNTMLPWISFSSTVSLWCVVHFPVIQCNILPSLDRIKNVHYKPIVFLLWSIVSKILLSSVWNLTVPLNHPGIHTVP